MNRKLILTVVFVCFALPHLVKAKAQDDPARAAERRDPKAADAKTGKAADPAPAGYTIGEQDVLSIDVWKEKEMSGEVVVRPDGKISLPLVGEVYVIGMTPVELQKMLADKLQPFVTIPQVTVTVREIKSRKVYVIGQVAHPGAMEINSTTTVYQILAEAGGLRDFANRKKIYVLRRVGGKEKRLPFNYNAFVKGKPNAQDITLQPGDSIVVP